MKALRRRRAGRIGRDPHWVTLRYKGACSKCGAALKKGTKAFYYPNDKTLYGKDCCPAADEATRDFQAHDFDDRVMAAQFGPHGGP